jgi:hypothetical protein
MRLEYGNNEPQQLDAKAVSFGTKGSQENEGVPKGDYSSLKLQAWENYGVPVPDTSWLELKHQPAASRARHYPAISKGRSLARTGSKPICHSAYSSGRKDQV